jgi:hypothetical protein
MMFTDSQLKVVKYCVEECQRQHSGFESIPWMINAWDFAEVQATGKEANRVVRRVDLILIEDLGRFVEPIKNHDGFRRIPIFVGNRFEMHEKAPWERVPELLKRLVEAYYTGAFTEVGEEHYWRMHPEARSAEDEFYYEYENIHPFVDGNGRTGKIIYNYLLGRLDDPVMPPNFWGSANP